MLEGIKFLLSGTSVSHEAAFSSKEHELHANLPGSVTKPDPAKPNFYLGRWVLGGASHL